MNQTEAISIAAAYLKKLQAGCPVEIAFNEEVVEEHSVGFVFFYNSKQFWDTRDFAHSLAGNGPLLVKRETGELVVLASHQSVKKSLKELELGT